MPSLEDIERFKKDIRELGRETELLEQWKESYEDIPQPEQGIPADLSELMGSSGEEPPAPSAPEGEPETAADEAGGLASFLDNLSMEALPGAEEAESPLAGDLEAPESFSIPEGEAAVESLGKPVPGFEGLGEPGEVPGLAGFAAERPAAGVFEEEGAIPEDLLKGLAGDLESREPAVPEPEVSPFGQTPGLADEFASFNIPESAPGSQPSEEPLIPEEPFSFEMPEVPSQEATAEHEEVPLSPEELSILGGAKAGAEAKAGEEAAEWGIPEEPSEIALGEVPGEAGFEDFNFSIPELGEIEETGPTPSVPEASMEIGVPEEAAATAEAPAAEEAAFPEAELGELSPEGAGIPGLPEDAFDSFRLDEAAAAKGPAPAPGTPGGRSLDEEIASLENDLTPVDNFNLESAWGGADFSIPGFETPSPGPAKPSPGGRPARSAGPQEPRGQQEREAEEEFPTEIALSEAEVDALQDTLLAYPLNLRLAVEEILAESKGTEAQRARMVHMLVTGAAPTEAASLASRILRRPISVPKGFEKRTGAALEAEKGSLRYILAHTVAPIAAMVLAVVLGLGVVGFLGYRFVYRPVHAEFIYRQGYEELRNDRFPEAESAFGKAEKVWVHKRWFYRYAEAFAAKNQFISAAHRYDMLLGRWPNDRKGVLDYARMEFLSRLDYAKAARLLKGFIEANNYYDKDGLVLLGDVYLEWAESEGDRGARLFEDARLQYSTLVEHYGPEDAYMERMLRWFLRTDRVLGKDNSKQILELKERFTGAPKSKISALTLADLGGYLLDHDRVDDVSQILMRAVKEDPSVPEAHYELSRYFRRIQNPQEEKTALSNTVRLLESMPAPTNRRIGMLVEALVRSGEGFAEAGEFITAEDMYSRAIQRYERALGLGQLRKSAAYGKAYANLADILFFQRDDLDGALSLYEKAKDSEYITADTYYKQGYIHYRRERWEKALENFYRAGLDSDESPYLLYSTGNTLFQREDYFAAQGYYSRLVDRLKFELERLALVEPQARASHGEIVDLLMRTQNNLGVSLYRIGNRMGDARRRAGAMAQFTESSRYYDALERDPKTMIRPETKNLGYLNLDFILHPQRGIDLSIYPDLAKEMKFPKD